MKVQYVSEDGRVFDNEDDCRKHESIDYDYLSEKIEHFVQTHGSQDDRGNDVMYAEDFLELFKNGHEDLKDLIKKFENGYFRRGFNV